MKVINKFEVADNQTLLIVKVNKTKFTGKYPYECDEDCVAMHFWFVYQADVLSVVSGDFEEKAINFAALHHASYIKEVTDEWYILIEEFKQEKDINDTGVKYRAVDFDAKFFHKD